MLNVSWFVTPVNSGQINGHQKHLTAMKNSMAQDTLHLPTHRSISWNACAKMLREQASLQAPYSEGFEKNDLGKKVLRWPHLFFSYFELHLQRVCIVNLISSKLSFH